MPASSRDLAAQHEERAPTYTLRMHGVAIGYSSLEQMDAATLLVRGDFRPALGYELVEPIFALHADALARGELDTDTLARFTKARAALPLELIGPTGRAIPAEEIHIHPARAGGEPSLSARVTDTSFWSSQARDG